MTVATDGTAYVTQFGFDTWGGTTDRLAAPIIAVAPDGTVSVAAEGLMCPNGIAFDADEHQVFVAEPAAMRITRFDRADGTLVDGVEFATLPKAEGAPYAAPDGLCVDEAGGVWAADPIGGQVVRLDRDGVVTDVIDHPVHALARTLGGDDGRTLFVCATTNHHKPSRTGAREGRCRRVPCRRPRQPPPPLSRRAGVTDTPDRPSPSPRPSPTRSGYVTYRRRYATSARTARGGAPCLVSRR